MTKEKIGGIGCLWIFILFIIFFIIRFQVAPGKSWEKPYVNFTTTFYWFGVAYMVIIVIVNYKPKVTINEEQNIISSIEYNKREIEKYAFQKNGIIITQGFEFHLSKKFSELFYLQDKLKFYRKKRSNEGKHYPKKDSHEYRRKLIEERLKNRHNGLWGSLYEGELFHLYHAIGECQAEGCHNKVSEDWHTLCHSCFKLENYDINKY